MVSHNLEQRLRGYFEATPAGVTVAYLFGSQARGTARSASDVDIAVLFDPVPPLTLAGRPVEMQQDLESITQCRVDLIVLNEAPPDLVHRVLRDGIILVERDRGARIRFEIRARNEYFDLLPALREYRRPRPSGAGTAP